MQESLLLLVISLFLGIYSIYCQEMRKMNMDITSPKKIIKKVSHQMMLPMPFFTHKGIPYDVSDYEVSLVALPTRIDGQTNTKFNFQFEAGLSKTVGHFIGCDGLFDAANYPLIIISIN